MDKYIVWCGGTGGRNVGGFSYQILSIIQLLYFIVSFKKRHRQDLIHIIYVS